MILVIASSCPAFHPAASIARTIRVPGDAAKIATALDVARTGDSVLVAPGKYNEWWLRMGGGVKLLGAGSAVTFIDATGAPGGAWMLYCNGVGPEGEVSGFTFRNGWLAINADYAGLAIANNRFETLAGGIYSSYSACRIENNLFVGLDGAAIAIGASAGEVTRNTIVGCSDVGIWAGDLTTTRITRNIIVGNFVGVLRVGYLEVPFLFGCNDVWGNTWADYYSMPDQTGFNGNISADPLFCDEAGGDLHLDAASPCAAGGFGCDLMGALPVGCGATATEPTTWGMLKGLFRP